MSRVAVVYKSKYGSTKKYASWIAEELNADLLNASEIKAERLLPYDTVIYGGGLYAGGINGVNLLTNGFNLMKGKNLIVFTVGLSNTEDKSIYIPIINKNFTKEMQERITFFHLRGGIDYKKLSFLHKIMMAMLIKITKKKGESELSDEERLMVSTYGDQIDFSDKQTITPLIDFVKGIH